MSFGAKMVSISQLMFEFFHPMLRTRTRLRTCVDCRPYKCREEAKGLRCWEVILRRCHPSNYCRGCSGVITAVPNAERSTAYIQAQRKKTQKSHAKTTPSAYEARCDTTALAISGTYPCMNRLVVPRMLAAFCCCKKHDTSHV